MRPRSGYSLSTQTCLLALLASLVLGQIPLSPADDPFYQPPDGFASSAPGTVLRSRNVEAALFGFIPEPVAAYQLLYRTTAINGSAIATVTTIFRPSNAKTDRFVSFHTAEDSSALKCAPSYNYELGANQTDLIVTVENLVLQAYLASGYVVSSPDYEGPDAAFSPGHLEGMGVLDSMRAVQNFASNLSLINNAAIFGTGYSGGGIATGWAASLQHVYAPELNIKGWASGGTPANLTGTLVLIDDTIFSGFIPAAIDGLNKPSTYFAELNPIIEQIATPQGQEHLDFSNANCAVDDLLAFSSQSVFSTQFQSLGAQILYQPTIAAVLEQQIMGINTSETPVAPVLLYHASQDEIIPYLNASTLYSNWCADGATVHFTTYDNGGHLTTEILGLVPAIQFASAVFSGTAPGGCSQSDALNNSLDPLALGVELEPILTQLLNVLVLAGQDDDNIKNNLSLLKESI